MKGRPQAGQAAAQDPGDGAVNGGGDRTDRDVAGGHGAGRRVAGAGGGRRGGDGDGRRGCGGSSGGGRRGGGGGGRRGRPGRGGGRGRRRVVEVVIMMITMMMIMICLNIRIGGVSDWKTLQSNPFKQTILPGSP